MNGRELLEAIEDCSSVFIGISLIKGEAATYMKWRDESMAIRRKVRALAKAAIKKDPKTTFNARVSDNGVERTLLIGDETQK